MQRHAITVSDPISEFETLHNTVKVLIHIH